MRFSLVFDDDDDDGRTNIDLFINNDIVCKTVILFIDNGFMFDNDFMIKIYLLF